MPARFCPQCGTATVPNAKFCMECGTPLAGKAGAPARAEAASDRWQLTTGGLGVLGFFLVGGLGIWALVLSPPPPPTTLGASPARPGAAAPPRTAQADLPADHPKVPMQIPAEVKTFIDDLAKKASAAPNDVATWGRLAQVYYRTAQIDPTYYDKAKSTFEHVLEIDPKNTDALRGLGSVHFELDEPEDAIRIYTRYLGEKPDDLTVRTALGASYVSAGKLDKGVEVLRDVIAKKPDTWPAHYYLGVALDQQGDNAAGLASVKRARELTTEDSVRAQMDDTIARMSGQPPPSRTAAGPDAAGAGERAQPPAANLTAFQTDVEKAFRGHQIMGPKLVRFEWTAPGSGRAVMSNFPMSAMPEPVKQKFTQRLSDALRDAAKSNPPGGTVQVEIADAASGEVMATVVPSPN
jgi:cytochrome c-type biogenesis protein CcmH/NrfG